MQVRKPACIDAIAVCPVASAKSEATMPRPIPPPTWVAVFIRPAAKPAWWSWRLLVAAMVKATLPSMKPAGEIEVLEKSSGAQASMGRGRQAGEHYPAVHLRGVSVAEQQGTDPGRAVQRGAAQVQLDAGGPPPAQDVDDRTVQPPTAQRVDVAGQDQPDRAVAVVLEVELQGMVGDSAKFQHGDAPA
jgi:hypothetical protein